ncbi:hypothetical protein OG430_30810 [Streptomyces sp. NBC_01304]|nr:hypothetical protein OG430_30810 [Streptomyces sp. NBC_01304]
MSLVGPGTGTAQAAGRCKGHKVDTLWFSTGSVKIYRSGNKLCALTVAKRTGSKKPMMVSIQARGHRPVTISGKAKKYMGGVTVTAGRTRPVWVRGSVGAGKVSDGWLHV